MIRKAEIDLDGPLVFNRRYKPYYTSRFTNVNKVQKLDQRIVLNAAHKVFGLNNIKGWGFEWPDQIPDYLDENLTKLGKPRLVPVYFDHYLFIEIEGIIYPVVGESDTEDHYNREYCKEHDYDFNAIQYKDRRKNIWAHRSNTAFFRLPYYLSESEKFTVMYNFFTWMKNEITNCS